MRERDNPKKKKSKWKIDNAKLSHNTHRQTHWKYPFYFMELKELLYIAEGMMMKIK